MPALVQHLGALGVLYWFARNMLRYERTRRIFGPLRTHLLGTTVSLINGCEYCAFGSAYALDLIYLRNHGRLFPLTVAEILQLRGRDPRPHGRRADEGRPTRRRAMAGPAAGGDLRPDVPDESG